jgi:hypothetical protein
MRLTIRERLGLRVKEHDVKAEKNVGKVEIFYPLCEIIT